MQKIDRGVAVKLKSKEEYEELKTFLINNGEDIYSGFCFTEGCWEVMLYDSHWTLIINTHWKVKNSRIVSLSEFMSYTPELGEWLEKVNNAEIRDEEGLKNYIASSTYTKKSIYDQLEGQYSVDKAMNLIKSGKVKLAQQNTSLHPSVQKWVDEMNKNNVVFKDIDELGRRIDFSGGMDYNTWYNTQGSGTRAKAETLWPYLLHQVEIFNGIYIGDVVVSLCDVSPYRNIEDMFVALPSSSEGCLKYDDPVDHNTSSLNPNEWRKATPEEVAAYREGVRNTKDIKKPDLYKSALDMVDRQVQAELHEYALDMVDRQVQAELHRKQQMRMADNTQHSLGFYTDGLDRFHNYTRQVMVERNKEPMLTAAIFQYPLTPEEATSSGVKLHKKEKKSLRKNLEKINPITNTLNKSR